MSPSPVTHHSSRFFAAALALALAVLAPAAEAQSYPSRPIRLVVGSSPGGVTDLLARTTAGALAPMLSQNVVVDNRPGASGNMAMELVSRSPADGHTLLLISSGNVVVAPYLYRLSFDPITDLVPVFNMADAPHLIVVPGTLQVRDLREFIAYARASPGKVNYGSAGSGSAPHLSAERFARAAGLQLVHVPYKGVGPGLPDLVAGRIQMMMVTLGSARPHLPNNALKPLAVSSKRRLTGLPEVPTSEEAGLPGWQMTTWFGVFAPRGTGPGIVNLLNAKLQAVIDDPRGKQRLVEFGCEPVGGPARSFAELVRADYKTWGPIVRDAGVKLE
ncbi:MAG TPA: tripartite tricarboxylate transporter substrate binding protein [Burkholderiales bacterium]|nr:tripartite tricarboxylate transporter substrate binding protein [Burkholderiales bacterium]